jgi:hypothetical protein
MTPLSAAGPIESAIVLAADDPQQLAGFYGLLLGRAPEPGLSARHWRLPLPSGGRLEIYAPSSRRPRPRQHGRLGVCATRPAGPDPALQPRGPLNWSRCGWSRSERKPGWRIRRATRFCCWCKGDRYLGDQCMGDRCKREQMYRAMDDFCSPFHNSFVGIRRHHLADTPPEHRSGVR